MSFNTIQNYEYKFINKAIEMSSLSQLNNKHGSIIVSNKKIMSCGYNHERTKYKIQSIISNNCESCACHAEMDAIYKALNILPNYLFHPKKKRQLVL